MDKGDKDERKNGEQEEGPPTCFICTDGRGEGEKGKLYTSCKCNLLVHKQCFMKLIRVDAHKEKCCICLTPYSLDEKREYVLDVRSATSISFSFFVFVVYTSIIYYVITTEERQSTFRNAAFVMSFIIGYTAGSCILYARRERRNGRCFLYKEIVTIVPSLEEYDTMSSTLLPSMDSHPFLLCSHN